MQHTKTRHFLPKLRSNVKITPMSEGPGNDTVRLKDLINQGIAESASDNIFVKPEPAPEEPQKNYSLDDFISPTTSITVAANTTPPAPAAPMHSISGRIKISGTAGGMTIEKIDEQINDNEDSEQEDLHVPYTDISEDIVIQRPQDVLHEWSKFSQLQLGVMDFVNQALQNNSDNAAQESSSAITKLENTAAAAKSRNESSLQVLAETLDLLSSGHAQIQKELYRLSRQVNLIALNASLESARSGLPVESSKDTIEDLRKLAATIENFSSNISAGTTQIAEKISAAKDNISSDNTAEDISKLAQNLAGAWEIPQKTANIVNILKLVMQYNQDYQNSAVMSLGVKISGEKLETKLVDDILATLNLNHMKNSFIEYLAEKGFV